MGDDPEIEFLLEESKIRATQDVEKGRVLNNAFKEVFTKDYPPHKYSKRPNFFKWITFFDINTYLKRINDSSNEDLDLSDLPPPHERYNVESKVIDLDYYWNKQLETKDPSFYKALCRAFRREIFISISLNFTDSTARLCYSLFLAKIVNAVGSNGFQDDNEKIELFQSAICLSILILISYFCVQWASFQSFINAGKARLAITGLLYKKLNCISLSSLQDFKIGKVINLIANDLNDIDYGALFLGIMLLCPYIIGLAVFIMWQYFGFSAILAVGSSIVFLLGQVYFSNKTVEPRKENKQWTDDRVKFTKEVIENIRLIKMYAWEKPFRKKIEKLREKEYSSFMRIVKLDALGRGLSVVSSYISILLICTTYTNLGGILSPDKVYGSMIILNYLSVIGLMYFHLGRTFLVNFKVILKRVEQIMLINEVVAPYQDQDAQIEGRNEVPGLVIFDHFTGYWKNDAQTPSLSNINLTIRPGTLTTILGKIGSGKTSLLLSILKELPFTIGFLSFSGKVAYVEQEPIIFSGTVKDNVLFGKDYNESLYQRVITICNLDLDLRTFPNGDMTLIGEKGDTLSGGQKARISLARAIYSESDIYLLDDPFSAVDSQVARNIFEEGLRGDLLRNKTLILVTHHLHFAKESDYIVVMKNGEIEAQGTFLDIENRNLDFLNILDVDTSNSRKSSFCSENSEQFSQAQDEENKDDAEKAEEKIQIENTTEKAPTVSWGTYENYLKLIGKYKDLIIFLVLFLAFQGLAIYYTRLIGLWALQHSIYHSTSALKDSKFDDSYYIIASWVSVVLIYILSYLKRIKLSDFLLSTNTELHCKMVYTLTRAKISFFDFNPIGRILNRFSNDIGALDKPNLISAFDLLDGMLNSFSLFLVVCLINPPLFIPAVVVIFFLYRTKEYLAKPNILTKKLELSSRSPIFSTVSSTLFGLIVIRVYNQGNRMIREFLDILYNNSKAFLFMIKTQRLLNLSLDAFIKILMIIGIMTFSWIILDYHFESALFGLSLLYILQVGDHTSYAIRQTLVVDINMQSAERMLEYSQIESEAPEEVLKNDSLVETQFQGDWPTRGDIIFNEVYFKYRPELDYSLSGLSFSIKDGTKVALVGRTGAGKSSVIQALFRMVEIEDSPNSYIKIDTVDIRSIGLNFLRRSISIIPQTPVVFSGTIRRNLDPFENHSDDDIWHVLEEVNLKTYVLSLDEKLQTDMTISASVFSAGQKQLICLARALLAKTKIIVLDEATANVDVETDDFIQKMIMEKFADCTVLTIAHRLITIAHYDEVIVLDKGQKMEHDSPYRLLVEKEGDDRITNRDGLFAQMVKSTGTTMSKKIFTIAKNHYFTQLSKKY